MIKSTLSVIAFSLAFLILAAGLDHNVPDTKVCVGDAPKNVPRYSEVVYEDCQMKGVRHGANYHTTNNNRSGSRDTSVRAGVHYVSN